MSVSLLTPDLRRILASLATRIGNLERRVNPTSTMRFTPSLAHPGTGENSVILEPSDSGAVANSSNGIAIGAGATTVVFPNGIALGALALADNDNAIAMGSGPTSDAAARATGSCAVAIGASYDGTGGVGAYAFGAGSVAIGGGATGANAGAAGGVAIGSNSLVGSTHTGSVAIGESVLTLAAGQVNIGQNRIVVGVPDSAPSDSHLNISQASFYLDEGSNLLKIKVKYADGTVKIGSVGVS